VTYYKTKRTTGNTLVKALDRAFSEYIRLTWANPINGYCKCVTCGSFHHWRDIDCGHYMSRTHKATRWNTINCSPQCKICNRLKGGEQCAHGMRIDQLHGPGTAERLRVLSKQTAKYPDLLLMKMTVDYREKVKALRKEKGL
jgi:hypothetical protein